MSEATGPRTASLYSEEERVAAITEVEKLRQDPEVMDMCGALLTSRRLYHYLRSHLRKTLATKLTSTAAEDLMVQATAAKADEPFELDRLSVLFTHSFTPYITKLLEISVHGTAHTDSGEQSNKVGRGKRRRKPKNT